MLERIKKDGRVCRRALGVSKLSASADGVKRPVNYFTLICHHMMWRRVNGR